MICKCQYFEYKDGALVCSVCGKPAHENKIEDKVIKIPELKVKKTPKK